MRKRSYDTNELQNVLAARDGWICFYCGKKLIESRMYYYLITGIQMGYEDLIRENAIPQEVEALLALKAGADEATIDHKVPISKGGDPKSIDNVVLCCFSCNTEKSNRFTHEEFLQRKKKEAAMVEKGDEQLVRSSGLRKYRTELPNLLDDSDLDPYEFRLYVHYVRVGNCFEKVGTTAAKTHMSVGQVVAVRKSLQEKGWIEVGVNSYGTYTIKVVDKWPENFAQYSTVAEDSQGEAEIHVVNEDSHSEREIHVVNPTVPQKGHSSTNPVHTVNQRSTTKKNQLRSTAPSAPESAEPQAVDTLGGEVQAAIQQAMDTLERASLPSEAEREFFKQFKRKRWSTDAQRDLFRQTEAQVGPDKMLAAVKWAAINGIANVQSVCTAAKNFGAGGGKPKAEQRSAPKVANKEEVLARLRARKALKNAVPVGGEVE